MPRFVKVVTLGCPKNQVDSRQIMGYFNNEGFTYTSDESQANTIVINTCGFIEDAKRESIETILELSQWKEKGNCEHLIVTGCLVQKYYQELKEELPEVDLFLGTGDISYLPKALQELTSQQGIHRVTEPGNYLYNDSLSLVPDIEAGHYAYLKIAEGCDNRCTYCVIPELRGKYRSRPLESIIKEAHDLADRGTKEIILVAQDTTYYGKDLYNGLKLPQLLQEMVRIPGINWIRLLYCYPDYITDELLQTIKNEDKICSYLDIPLQHVSDKVLRAMGRSMKKKDILNLLNRIRSHIPHIVLRTTFIVGFPGETEAEFKELLDFIQEFPFERAGFFKYSRENDTPAYSLPDQVSDKEKERRLELITSVQKDILSHYQSSQVGKIHTIIVDGPSADYEGLWEGRTPGDAPEIDSVVYFQPYDQIKTGDIVKSKITHSQEYALMGELVK